MLQTHNAIRVLIGILIGALAAPGLLTPVSGCDGCPAATEAACLCCASPAATDEPIDFCGCCGGSGVRSSEDETSADHDQQSTSDGEDRRGDCKCPRCGCATPAPVLAMPRISLAYWPPVRYEFEAAPVGQWDGEAHFDLLRPPRA